METTLKEVSHTNLPNVDKSKLDDMHFDSVYAPKLFSYQKPKMAVVSPRELGKSAWWWLFAYNRLKKYGETSICFRYIQADVTDVYIDDIGNLLNKFMETPIELVYKRGSIKDGIVDVSIKTEDGPVPFFRVVVINLPLRRLKSLMYPGLKWMVFDEYIVDTVHGETYPSGVGFKINEIFKTFNRECDGKLRMIFLGNAYSVYCPVHTWMKADIKQLYPGNTYIGEDCVIMCALLPDRLRDYILARDASYKFDDTYSKYAFDGRAVNDDRIRIYDKLPENYFLRYVFYIENRKLCIYRTNDQFDYNNVYWIGINDDYHSDNRDIITFDYNSLVEGTILMGNEDKKWFRVLKNAFRFRKIQFKTQEEYYLFEEIYNNL